MPYTFATSPDLIRKIPAGLVAGFSVTTRAADGSWLGETLYAVTEGGQFFAAKCADGTRDFFNHPTREWQAVETIPADAGWLGNYVDTFNTPRAA